MPTASKRNWDYHYDVYQEFLKKKPGTSSSDFARQNGLPDEACRKAFKRIDARRTRTPRTETGRTGVQGKVGIFSDVSTEEAVEVIKNISYSRSVALHSKILVSINTAMERIKTLQKCEKKILPETMKDLKDGYGAVIDVVRVQREIGPFILELQDRAKLEEIFTKLQDREYDITQASLEISKLGANLPEALRIMLSKTPPIMIANNFESPDMDELDQRALETLKQVQWQHECFLPQRRQEVIEMKQEMKGSESFAPEEKKGNPEGEEK